MSDKATLIGRLSDMGETQRIQEASLKAEYRSETNIGLEAAARIAELEAANAVCRRDIEALMSSCDKLEARNAGLETERDRLRFVLAHQLIDQCDPPDAPRFFKCSYCQQRAATREQVQHLSACALSDPSGE